MTATVNANQSVNANTYAWDFGDNFTSALAVPTHNYVQPGTYPITLVASNDHCADTVSFEVVVDNAGLGEVNSLACNVYPNPTHNLLTIKTNGVLPNAYSIYDATGRCVKFGKVDAAIQEISVADLARGTYRIELLFNGIGSYSKPFTRMD
jgi:PKD repeat protein